MEHVPTTGGPIKRTWHDLTPYERRHVVEYERLQATIEANRRARAKAPDPQDDWARSVRQQQERLARYGVTVTRAGYYCGQFRLPWPIDTPGGLRAFRASLVDEFVVQCG